MRLRNFFDRIMQVSWLSADPSQILDVDTTTHKFQKLLFSRFLVNFILLIYFLQNVFSMFFTFLVILSYLD